MRELREFWESFLWRIEWSSQKVEVEVRVAQEFSQSHVFDFVIKQFNSMLNSVFNLYYEF